MAKFHKGGSKEVPQVSTAALPDIVFMLLFFFMVSTTMREVELKVKVQMPMATEIKKLENKSLVTHIYVGKPLKGLQGKFGTEPLIQLSDDFATLGDIQQYIIQEREKIDEVDRQKMTMSLKVDEKTKMGVISDIKEELKIAEAFKLNYATRRKVVR